MPSIAQLTGLTLSGVSLTPAFASGTTAYTATVGYGVRVTTVAATAETGATATVLPADSDTDTTGHQEALQVGSNDITVTVMKAGASTRTYTVVVTREPPDAVAVPGISLCEARLSETEPVWRQAEVDICWNVGSAFRKDSDVVFEWQRRFFWGDDVTNSNPWSPWREFARGDTYTQCGRFLCAAHARGVVSRVSLHLFGCAFAAAPRRIDWRRRRPTAMQPGWYRKYRGHSSPAPWNSSPSRPECSGSIWFSETPTRS